MYKNMLFTYYFHLFVKKRIANLSKDHPKPHGFCLQHPCALKPRRHRGQKSRRRRLSLRRKVALGQINNIDILIYYHFEFYREQNFNFTWEGIAIGVFLMQFHASFHQAVQWSNSFLILRGSKSQMAGFQCDFLPSINLFNNPPTQTPTFWFQL